MPPPTVATSNTTVMMALLPALDNLLDEETDREIAFAYTAG